MPLLQINDYNEDHSQDSDAIPTMTNEQLLIELITLELDAQ